jgi:hypothetical protein
MNAFAGPCRPNESYVRKQWINGYIKQDGTKVEAHIRQAHCRLIEVENYFQNATTQRFKNLKTSIRPWLESEKKIILDGISILPLWLKKYALKEVLRADIGGHPDNPAATIPQTRTLVIFDKFFKSKDQKSILIHEISHIAFYDFTPTDLVDFANASGWVLTQKSRFPPIKLLSPDSAESISEDFANHIESYYVDEKNLMLSHPLSYVIIKQLIRSKESSR